MTRVVQKRILHAGFIAMCVSVTAVALAGQAKPETPTITAAPEPSAEVQKDFEVLTLKAQLTQATKQISELQAAVGACQAQLAPLQFEQNRTALQTEQKSIIDKYERANPGFTIDVQTGKPVKKPEPDKPKG